MEVVFYHRDMDGIGAAWAHWANAKWAAGAYAPIDYLTEVEDIEGELIGWEAGAVTKVTFVDHCPQPETIRALERYPAYSGTEGVIIVDHHKSNADIIGELRELCQLVIWDTSRSGAALVWQLMGEDKPVPRLLEYIEDRDLWKWEMPFSREINEALSLEVGSLGRMSPDTMSTMDGLSALAADLDNCIAPRAAQGSLLLKSKRRRVAGICKNAYWGKVAGHRVPIVNTGVHVSDVGNELVRRHPGAAFAVVFWITDGRLRYSLWSDRVFDVSAVAKRFGGGGHPGAAGFGIELEPGWVAKLAGIVDP